MKKNYSPAEIYKIVKIDRRAGDLIKLIAEDNPRLYPRDNIVNEGVYKQFKSVLKDAEQFRDIFFNFDKNYEGRNPLSKRMSLIAMVYDSAKSMIKEGVIKLADVKDEVATPF